MSAEWDRQFRQGGDEPHTVESSYIEPLPAAAWYPDPEWRGYCQYWEGMQWTQHRVPLGQQAPIWWSNFWVWFWLSFGTATLLSAVFPPLMVVMIAFGVVVYLSKKYGSNIKF